MPKDVMTVAEMAEFMRISKPKAYELTRIYDFPVDRIGRKKIIRMNRLIEWLDNRQPARVR